MHRSISNEASGRGSGKINNERLEFLGDSILGAVCASLLFQSFKDKPEGELAKIKAVIVSEDILSQTALNIGIDKMLLLGKGEEMSGGRTKKTILADAMEALIGALYLDSGFKEVYKFVSRCIQGEINKAGGADYHKDFKSILQEYCQQQFRCYPEYNLIKRTGPEHDRIFWMEICIDSAVYGSGKGRNKKSAEQEAAKAAWQKLTENS